MSTKPIQSPDGAPSAREMEFVRLPDGDFDLAPVAALAAPVGISKTETPTPDLPPLPEMSDLGDSGASNYGYSADDMHAYARAALAAPVPQSAPGPTAGDAPTLSDLIDLHYKYAPDCPTSQACALVEAVVRQIAPAPQAVPGPTVDDNSQDWAGMDGVTAFLLIQRHADGWADVGKMMGEWLAANRAAPSPAKGDVEFHNPWRASLENCISGDNYLRASEYHELVEELDDLYRLRAAKPRPKHTEAPAVGRHVSRAAESWRALTETMIDAYLEDYEMVGEDDEGRDACHTPSEGERFLIKDAVMGLLQAAWDSTASNPPVQHKEQS